MIATKDSFEAHSSEQLPSSKKIYVEGVLHPAGEGHDVWAELGLERHLDRLEAIFSADLGTYAHSAGR